MMTSATINAEPVTTDAHVVLTQFTEQDQLPVFRGVTYDDHVQAWHTVEPSKTRYAWALAAIATSIERRCEARTDRSRKATDLQRFCADAATRRAVLDS
jgi:hypothetical protein